MWSTVVILYVLLGATALPPGLGQPGVSKRFDDQVLKLLAAVYLSPHESVKLSKLCYEVESKLRSLWPVCVVKLFGSSLTGTVMNDSDVDCCVILPLSNKLPELDRAIMAKHKFDTREDVFTNATLKISYSGVPTVKLKYILTGRTCDVSFSRYVAVRDSELVEYLLKLSGNSVDLVRLIKYWTKSHGLMSGYCTTLLVLFYLQQRNIVPSVVELQKGIDAFMMDHWNVGFNTDYSYETRNESLYRLAGGFFEYYGEFNFDKYIVSPFVGRPIEKKLFDNLTEIPGEFVQYKQNVDTGKVNPLSLKKEIIILDIFNHNVNVASKLYPQIVTQIKTRLKSVAKIYREQSEHYFLHSLLTTNEDSGEL